MESTGFDPSRTACPKQHPAGDRGRRLAHRSLSPIPRITRKAIAMTDLIFLGATILSFAVCIAYLVAYKKL